jgi:hypothetical protein
MNELNSAVSEGETTTIITKTVSAPKKQKRAYTWTPKRAESFKRCQEARSALREQMKELKDNSPVETSNSSAPEKSMTPKSEEDPPVDTKKEKRNRQKKREKEEKSLARHMKPHYLSRIPKIVDSDLSDSESDSDINSCVEEEEESLEDNEESISDISSCSSSSDNPRNKRKRMSSKEKKRMKKKIEEKLLREWMRKENRKVNHGDYKTHSTKRRSSSRAKSSVGIIPRDTGHISQTSSSFQNPSTSSSQTTHYQSNLTPTALRFQFL